MSLNACPTCGNAVAEGSAFCAQCGRPLMPIPEPLAIAAEPAGVGQDPLMRMLLPVGRSAWAIAAGYLGLFAVMLLPAPFALLAGIIAVFDINKHPNRHGMGRAIFGIVMGVLGSFGLLVVLALSAFA